MRPGRLQLLRLEERAIPAVITVTSAADVVLDDGQVTLREAMDSINAGFGVTGDVIADTKSGAEPYGTADEIRFGTLFGSPQTIMLDPAFGQIPINLAVTITGPGSGNLTISGDITPTPTNRIFNIKIDSGLDSVTLSGMTLANGLLSTGNGGGILFANETLTLNGMVVTNNKATSGGGIASSAATTINVANSTISLNQANGNAGGIGMIGTGTSSVTITNSVLQSNICTTTTGFGGAVYCGNIGIVNVANSLFDANSGGVGSSAGLAGAIYISSTATSMLTNSVFRNNQAGAGGAIRYQGATNLTIDSCLFEGNQSTKANGGVGRFTSTSTTVNVMNSSFLNNTSFTGGGVFGIEGANSVVTVTNSTLSGNTANGTTATTGGAVLATTTSGAAMAITFNHCTLTNNTVPSGVAKGGAIFINGVNGTLTLNSTIVAGNSNSVARDISASAARSIAINQSLIGALNSAIFPAPSGSYDPLLVGTEASPIDAMLDPLADNGGPYMTHKLQTGSPAIDAGNNPMILPNDQRGGSFLRTVDNPSIPNALGGDGTDIGALEIQGMTTPPTVSSIMINGVADAQRSLITSIKITFSEAVMFPNGIAAAFDLQRYALGTPGPAGLSFNQTGSSLTITFTTTVSVPLDPGDSLPDGQYRLTIIADNVMGTGGKLDGNGNMISEGSPTDNKTTEFHRLFGDGNGDGSVTASDFNAFRLVYGSPGPSFFDYDGGGVSASDFNAFRLRYGASGYLP